ncbi:P-loop containing nucleoside triphosphate hydrolase protein [Radiomyces spectabilis]|uniref:P-loop containing nucleoside triphosphate hydrolase protein n=1 Tax=Radiomyces spectabilis TaxID=64574 RepID=UPI002220B252|nr:P-loop containing nucleoside triphosphate hydrolase protein [Radiomyces spectabilis]KAI8376166.1 P-loop containing nucleoside triphosphate hydrolase protein [Radiomyces spectabilis]
MAKEGHGQIAAVQVALRIRPLTERDRAKPRFAGQSSNDILRAHDKTVHVLPHNKSFTFDYVFGPDSRQSEIFSVLGQRLIQKFVQGYNVTILAYGQTSSGKTYTMGTAQHTGQFDMENEGIVPRAVALLFESLQNPPSPTSPSSSSTSNNPSSPVLKPQSLHPRSRISLPPSSSSSSGSNGSSSKYKYTVKVSFVEIYNEELIDLLNPAPPSEKPPVTIREDTKGHIYWTGVKELLVSRTQNRATSATDMNEKSSRSHAIFSVTLRQERWLPAGGSSMSRSASPVPPRQPKPRPLSAVNFRPPSNEAQGAEDGEWIITTSKFHFVDLAGSERLKRTAAEGDRRKEGININGGLLALGNVISALGDPSKRSTHVPYRDSKLTRLLQDSLGGSATTLMIACVSPAEHNLSETINTLGYANRARNIKNRVEKNEAEEWMTTDNVSLLRNMIEKLKNELRAKSSLPHLISRHEDGIGPPTPDGGELEQLYQNQQLIISDLQHQIQEIRMEASDMRDQNRGLEKEVNRLRQSGKGGALPPDVDFEHLVEPVIEEYEKSMASLESQLQMSRAALYHSDIGYKEQTAKLEQCEIVIEHQEQTLKELEQQLRRYKDQERQAEVYIAELEEKLTHTDKEAMRDQEMLTELKNRILKLKETDESTEKYIHDLEQQLAVANAAKAALESTLETMKQDAATTNNKPSPESPPVVDMHAHKLLLEELDSVRLELDTRNQQYDALKADMEALQEASAETGDKNASLIEELREEIKQAHSEHSESLKELDEVLLRYQEAHDRVVELEQQLSDTQKKIDDENEASQTESVGSRAAVDETAIEVENAKNAKNFDRLKREYTILKRKYDKLRSVLQLRKGIDAVSILGIYEKLVKQYHEQTSHLSLTLEEIKKLQSAHQEGKDPTGQDAQVIAHVLELDHQLLKQRDKMAFETQQFQSEVHALLARNRRVEMAWESLRPKTGALSMPRLPRQRSLSVSSESDMSRHEELDDASSTDASATHDYDTSLQGLGSQELVHQYESNLMALKTRLAMAQHGLRAHHATINKLQMNLQYAQDALLQQPDVSPTTKRVTESDIDDLMQRMNAMKLQLDVAENRPLKSPEANGNTNRNNSIRVCL